MKMKIKFKKSGILKAESENRLSDLGVSAVKHGRGGARPYRRFVKVKVFLV